MYHDIKKEVAIQVDASKNELGAALLQGDCPVTFTFKALTHIKQYNANIEYEMLVAVN